MADSIAKAYPGASRPPEVSDPVKRANAAFLARHSADLERLQRLEDARKAASSEEGADETEEPAEEEPPRRQPPAGA